MFNWLIIGAIAWFIVNIALVIEFALAENKAEAVVGFILYILAWNFFCAAYLAICALVIALLGLI